ncbi:hypothetical protein MBLNU230_g5263t1 [Neophaeotheca triangularis]
MADDRRSRSPHRSDPPSPPSPPASVPPNRPNNCEIMYCHECENEWYRQDSGLTCPECRSDFTEVIEDGNDPRDPPEEVPEPGLAWEGLRGHRPWGEEGGDGDGGLHWTLNGQGGMRATIRRDVTLGGDQQGQGQGQGFLGMFTPMLQGLLGAGQQQAQQRTQQHQHEEGLDEGEDGQQQGRGGGSTTHRHFSGPGFTMSYTTTTSGGMTRGGMMGGGMMGGGGEMNNPGLQPRDANNPQPMQGQPDDLQNILNQMFMNIGAGPGADGHHHHHPHHQHPPFAHGGGGGGPGMPFGNLFQLLGLPGGGPLGGGQMGDAVFSQEALDRVISQLMEQHQSGNAPGPASRTAIDALHTKTLTPSDLDPATGKADCSICMEDVEVGGEVTVLPCKHWFHRECVAAWLGEHDTCPQCRRGIMAKTGEDGEGRVRGEGEEPRVDMSNPPPSTAGAAGGAAQGGMGQASRQGMPGGIPNEGFPGQGYGQATGDAGAGGVFGRMRQAFGNGGGSGGAAGGASGGSQQPPPPASGQ